MTDAHRPRLLEAGLGLVVIGVPLIFFPGAVAPFADVKLVVLAAGTALVAAGAGPVNRRIAVAAGAWFAIVALAAAAGVDPWQSLMGGEIQGVGLLVLGPAALLLAAGTGVPPELAARLPVWILGAGIAVGTVQVAARLVPEEFPGATVILTSGSTLGQNGQVGGLAAAAVVCSVAARSLKPGLLMAAVASIASGLSASLSRGAWLAMAVGLAVAIRKSRLPLPRAGLIVATAALTITAWTVLDLARGPGPSVSAARKFAPGYASTDHRPGAWAGSARGFTRRPLLGWGPANTWGAFLSSVRADELRRSHRGYSDAHNILLESAVTTGVLGLGVLALLFALCARGAVRAPPSAGWAAGAAAALLVHHLLQPLSVTNTPLLFLFAGIAASGETPRVVLPRRAIGCVLGLFLALALARLGSSAVEQYGRTYDSKAALRLSLRLQPLRQSTAEGLAVRLTFDARASNREAALEARRLTARNVRRHPWSPTVRLHAADFEILLDNPAGAQAWLDRHLRRFPNDPVALSGAAVLAQRRGETELAVRLAKKSMAIGPSRRAARVLRELGASTT